MAVWKVEVTNAHYKLYFPIVLKRNFEPEKDQNFLHFFAKLQNEEREIVKFPDHSSPQFRATFFTHTEGLNI